MSQQELDLSRIPEPLRSKLREQLERLPAEYRGPLEAKLAKLPTDKLEEVLAKTAPMLERLAGKQKGSSAGAASNTGPKSAAKGGGSTISGGSNYEPTLHRAYDPHDHYNTTIQRGDRQGPTMSVLIVIVVLALLFMQSLGWLSTSPG